MQAEPFAVEEVSHLALHLGRLLFQNNADTAHVEDSVVRFAASFGYEAHLIVTYESLLVSLVSGEQFRTKVGHRIPSMNINMAAVTAVDRLINGVENGGLDLAGVRAELELIERRAPIYGRWSTVAALGLTAASLGRLFGGDWPTFAITLLAGATGTWLRQGLGHRKFNLFFVAFATALASGSIGGAAVRLGMTGTPALCLVVPGMILVPGVPLINGIQDIIKNHMTVGLARLSMGALITLSSAVGLFVATVVTGAKIPVNESSSLISLSEDALFSALAACGYLFLFNVPRQIAWACIVCGMASHTGRTLCLRLGMDIVSGTLIGASVVGFLAQWFARYFRAPAVAFSFPGVVAMVPGAFAFRAVIGWFQIVAAGSAASPALVADTLALSFSCLLMVAAIAIGVAAPLILTNRGTEGSSQKETGAGK
jgi:uncharacterized membrane protein YjjP (DUF1212 family)